MTFHHSAHTSFSSIATRITCFGWLLLALLLMPNSQSRAAGVLEHLPEGTLGFVHVHGLKTTDARVEKFMEMFELQQPSPLKFAEISLDIGEGIEVDGDALLATIPGGSESPTPEPLFVLPIADYEKFAASIKANFGGHPSVYRWFGWVTPFGNSPFAFRPICEHLRTNLFAE